MIKNTHILLCITMQLLVIHGEEILILQPFAWKSHLMRIEPLAKELGLRGHKVIHISTFGLRNTSMANVTQITFPQFKSKLEAIQEVVGNMFPDIVTLNNTVQLYNHQSELTHLFFQTQLLQNWIKERKRFSLVIIDGSGHEILMQVWNQIARYSIIFSTGVMPVGLLNPLNIPHPYAYVPNSLTHHTDKMNFYQRCVNSYHWLVFKALDYIIGPIAMWNIIRPYFPNTKSVFEVLKNVSLIMLNEDLIFTSPKPYLRTMVSVPGMHCRSPQTLPDSDLKKFVDSSNEDGFILFSFGSILNGDQVNQHLKNTFVKAFSKIKQKVVWKHESPVPNLPKNIMITQWFPQQDLLGHPKIRLFINHGGLLSLQEGLYNRVPQICMPMHSDQPHQCTMADFRGVAIKLDPKTLTVDQLVASINRAVIDTKLMQNVNYYSLIFKENIKNSVDKAVYWVEYVMRFNGAHHLKSSSADLNFFQYFLLDILCALILLFVSVVWVFRVLITLIFKVVFPDKSGKRKLKTS